MAYRLKHLLFILFSMKKYIAEAMWVLFLTLIIGLSGDPLAIGVWLAILVYATWPISGGHLNPAVTLAMLVNKKMRLAEAVNYWVAQLGWAILGALLYLFFKGNTIIIMPLDGVSWIKAWLGEFIFTFLLVMVVYLTAAYKKAENNQYRGAAIWLTVFVAIVSMGRISWWAFNPAVATWSILIDWLKWGDSGMYLWLYLLFTLAWWYVAGLAAKSFKNDHLS